MQETENVDLKQDHASLVQTVLDTNGELPGQEYAVLADTLKGKQQEFIDGDSTQKALLKRELNVWSQNIGSYKNFRQELAAGFNTKALMNTWNESPTGKATMALLRDVPRLVQKECPENMPNCANKGELGVMMPNFQVTDKARKQLQQLETEWQNAPVEVKRSYLDPYIEERSKLLDILANSGAEWTSIGNLKKKIKLKDKGTKDALTAMGNNYISNSTQVNPADNVPFNYEACFRQVRTNILDKSQNFQSLIYDEMIPGRFFWKDLQDKVYNHQYNNEINPSFSDKKQVGLAMLSLGNNPAPQDVQQITGAILNDPQYREVLKDELCLYFTKFCQKQWDLGAMNRVDPTKDNNTNKKNQRNPDGSIYWNA